MANNHNFRIKNGLEVGGVEVITANGVMLLPSTSTAATQAGGANNTRIATTAFVQQEITTLIGGAPGSLNTLNELAAAINDDASYATTLTTALATKLPLAGGTLTGGLIGTTAAFSSLDVDGIIDNTYNNGNVSAPNNSNHTAGTRIKFYDSSTTSWYAMGIEGNTLWFNSDQNYKFYRQSALKVDFDSAGVVNAVGGYKVNGVLKSGNWDTAYTYSQVGHVELDGTSIITGSSASTGTRTPMLWMRGKTGDSVNQINVQGAAIEFGQGGTLDATPAFRFAHNGILTAAGQINASGGNSAQWNTAYGWGNHASAGYITDGNTNWNNSYGFITNTSGTAKGTNNNYVASSTSTSNRGNYGAGVWAYSGYSTGSNRPFTYDSTLQVMPAGNAGFELSVDWLGTTSTPFKIRSLRDCCQGWSTYSTVWTSTSDGSGSGLDADLLDGQHGSYYYSSANPPPGEADTLATVTGRGASTNTVITINNQLNTTNTIFARKDNVTNYTNAQVRLDSFGGSSSTAGLGFHISGSVGRYLFMNSSADLFWNTTSSKIWHAGNDGSGSGLDADLLDGQHGSYYYSSANPPPTDSQYLRSDTLDVMTYNTTSGEILKFANNTSGGKIQIGFQQNDTDGMHHRAYLKAWKGSTSASGNVDLIVRGTGGSITSDVLSLRSGNASPTWRGQTIWNAGNDGSGSGLDADLLDGQHGSYYYAASNPSGYTTYTANQSLNTTNSPTFANLNTTNAGYVGVGDDIRIKDVSMANTAGIVGQQNSDRGYLTFGNNTTQLGRIGTGALTWGGNTIWHSGNDGAGSGLDADTIDGYSRVNHLGVGEKINISVGGDADTWYPVVISGGGSAEVSNFQIYRAYSETAPSTWNNSTHMGGLSFKYSILGSNGWGGYPISIRVQEFGEIYSRILGGIAFTAHTMKHVVWLRGGTANYHIYSDSDISVEVNDSTSASNYVSASPHKWYSYDNSNNAYDVTVSERTSAQADSGVANEVYINMPVSYNSAGTPAVYGIATSAFNHKFWNSSNDGSGSGLDADLLDGQHGSYYAPASHNHSGVYNNYTHPAYTARSLNTSGAQVLDILTTDAIGSVTNATTRTMTLAELGYTGATNANYITNNNQLTNGAGYQTTSGSVAQSNYVSGSAFATTSSPGSVLEYQQASGQTDTKLAPSGDWHNSIRMGHGNPYSYYSSTIAIRMTGTGPGDLYTQTIQSNTAGGWSKHWSARNDGAGSGLDADLLDGQHGSYYAPASHNHSGVYLPISGKAADSELLDGVNGASYLRSDTNDSFTGNELHFPTLDLSISNNNAQNQGNTYFRGDGTHFVLGLNSGNTLYMNYGNSAGAFRTEGTITHNSSLVGTKPWGNSNDGSGSGLDADLLDGQQGSYYAPVSSIPTVNNGTLSITTSGSVSGGGSFTANNAGNVTLNLTGNGIMQGTNAPQNSSFSDAIGAGFRFQRVTGGTNRAYSSHHNLLQIPNSSGDQYLAQMAFGTGDTKLAWRSKSTSFGSWFDIWHSGNDGSGSGLDADTVDGVQGSSIVQTSGTQLIAGNKSFTGTLYMSDKLGHYGDSNTYMQFHAADQWRVVTGGTERLEINNTGIITPLTIKARAFQVGATTPASVGMDPGVGAGSMWLSIGEMSKSFAVSDGNVSRFVIGGRVGGVSGTGVIESKRQHKFQPSVATTSDATATIISKGSVDTTSGYSPQNWHIAFQDGGGTVRGKITSSHYSTQYSTSSDYRLKEDIQPIANATARLLAIEAVNFRWIDGQQRSDGFIAHELQEHLPEAVTGTKDATEEVTETVVAEDGTESEVTRTIDALQGVDQSKLVPLLVKTIQELEARITALENA